MRWIGVLLAVTLCRGSASASEPFVPERFESVVLPFVKKHCIACHNADDAEGGLDLTRFAKVEDLLTNSKPWQRVFRQV